MAITVGDQAPTFQLANQDNQLVDTSSFLGEKNLVIYFYPKAMTPGCTTQGCAINDSLTQFAELNTVVLGLSPDPVSSLSKFKNKYDFKFDLLSDEDHKIADQYGVWALKKFMGREYMGILRSTFIIDKKGKVIFVMDKVKTKSHHDDVLNILRKYLQ